MNKEKTKIITSGTLENQSESEKKFKHQVMASAVVGTPSRQSPAIYLSGWRPDQSDYPVDVAPKSRKKKKK